MNPLNSFHESWNPIRHHLHDKKLTKLNEEILPNISYKPERSKIFRAFSMPVKDVKVVILGQDPFYKGNSACGYSFVNGTDYIPPSLKVIYSEIKNGQEKEPNIRSWPEQGVLLLNTALTVETGKPNSHKTHWSRFATQVVRFISVTNPCVWLLWGSNAKGQIKNISKPMINVDFYSLNRMESMPMTPDMNAILTSPHPMVECHESEHEFYGNNHFLKTNLILEKKGKEKINW